VVDEVIPGEHVDPVHVAGEVRIGDGDELAVLRRGGRPGGAPHQARRVVGEQGDGHQGGRVTRRLELAHHVGDRAGVTGGEAMDHA
jgi:hypothetical protein